jgi:hypothetical protein
MTAVREQIFAAVETLLREIDDVLEVERMPSGDPGQFPALHIFDQGDKLTEGEAGTDRWEMAIGLDGYVSGGDGAEAHGAINALYSAVVEALFPEPVLGGLAHEIAVQAVQFVVADRGNARRLAFSADISIFYATRRGMPQIID